ncbi:zinc-dependent alcohol dehydrogenase family protein [Pseudogemmobacter humi]|uniref:Putative zinc-type alcohol dehydrogenase-like protein YjmD n=1 Tax=Pseudogemmobacter humi TaxID=2483812 RepID=A0A3P5XTY1_9RHOB|nr:zinc-dependent alcohol dehydrogenase family protein [Pseudogemmobacter humi]VDC33748.1 putative zinc-type alcohol dehydrogenase-like protein YjmD [Pseudogemmobacter humi]
MKALVYQGPGQKDWIEKERPVIAKPTDVIVRMTKTTICGTDLHILKGDVPAVTPGRTLGHEGVGVVAEVGSAVRNFKEGDAVLISCVTSCGSCPNCKRQLYAHCSDGGWILGHKIDGTQAEYVRIPHADNSLYPIPAGADEEALVMLSDIMPTGLEIGVQAGHVKPGDTIAIIGAGPVGMSVLLTSQFYSPGRIVMIDMDPARLELAVQFGATDTIQVGAEDPVARIMELTENLGVDVAIEAVGVPATFDICQKIVSAGGNIANVGVHGKPVELHIEELWIKNINIAMGLVCTNTTPMLLKTLQSGKVDPGKLVTHRFKLDEIMDAYEVFGNAAREKAMKVILAKIVQARRLPAQAESGLRSCTHYEKPPPKGGFLLSAECITPPAICIPLNAKCLPLSALWSMSSGICIALFASCILRSGKCRKGNGICITLPAPRPLEAA